MEDLCRDKDEKELVSSGAQRALNILAIGGRAPNDNCFWTDLANRAINSTKFIAPILEARLKTQNRMYSDPQLWMSELPNLPQLPFRISPDGTSVSYAPSRVVEAWLRVRMIERILAQVKKTGRVRPSSLIVAAREHKCS